MTIPTPSDAATMIHTREGSFNFRRGILLWLAAGAVAILPELGATPFEALFVGSLLVAAWILSNITPKQLIISITLSIIEIFFREMGSRNQFKVPGPNMPTIFICAPHANQFLDPFVVISAVGRTDVCYLAAAKSMRLRFVGLMARLLDSIPVERADDVAFQGRGTVWISPEDGMTVLGRGTDFTQALKPGDAIVVEGRDGPLAIRQVVSDEELLLKRPAPPLPTAADEAESGAAESRVAAAAVTAAAPAEAGGYTPYRVNPHVDQSAMFDSVHEALNAGKAIGIFPEGGSHDRTELLPLKAGVAIMALGALAKYPHMPLRLVPVGLNYFSGHRFRSRVFVDIGEPLTVPSELLPRYMQGGEEKRAATSELMAMLNAALSALTISAPDYDTLEFFWTLRRLIKSSSHGPMSITEQTELARRFAAGYERVLPDGRLWRETERVRGARERCAEYNRQLKSLMLRDYQVHHVLTHMTRDKALCLFLWRALMLLAATVLWLPMTLLSLPVLILTRLVSASKARQAVVKSSVKIHGRDVAATWKVLVALVLLPVLWVTYTWLSGELVRALYLGGGSGGSGGSSSASSRADDKSVSAVSGSAVSGSAGPLERKQVNLARLLTFFLLPVFAYAFILLSEQMLAIMRSLLPLLVIAVSPAKAQQIIAERTKLQQDMRTLVDDLGWRQDSFTDLTPRHTSTPSKDQRCDERWPVQPSSQGNAPAFPASPAVLSATISVSRGLGVASLPPSPAASTSPVDEAPSTAAPGRSATTGFSVSVPSPTRSPTSTQRGTPALL